jgi:hypothetical protein
MKNFIGLEVVSVWLNWNALLHVGCKDQRADKFQASRKDFYKVT